MKTPWKDLVNKGSNFADFVRFCPHTYEHTQQSATFMGGNNLTDLTLDHVFHTNIIAYCQQNRYVRLAIYTDLFILNMFMKASRVHSYKLCFGKSKKNSSINLSLPKLVYFL